MTATDVNVGEPWSETDDDDLRSEVALVPRSSRLRAFFAERRTRPPSAQPYLAFSGRERCIDAR